MEGDARIAAADSVGTIVDALVRRLEAVDGGGETGRGQLAVLKDLQRLSNAVAGAQVRVTAAFAEGSRQRGASARGIAADVALARRVGLSQGQRIVAAARTLVDDLPETLAALGCGELTETRATIVAEGVSHLEPAAREVVDDSLAGTLTMLGDGEVREAVATAAASVDPELVERRRRAALRDRRVTVRPAADGMAWLSILTTMAEAAEAETALRRHALGRRAEDGLGTGLGVDGAGPAPATLGGLMTDAAIARLTGRETHRGPLVEVQLVVTDRTLFARPGTSGREQPARIVGVGAIPAEAAREMVRPRATGHRAVGVAPRGPLGLVRDADHEDRRVTVRRLAVSKDQDLVGLERHRRFMPADARSVLVPPVGEGESSDRRSARGETDGRHDVDAWRRFLGRPPDPSVCADLTSAGRLFTGALRHFVVLRDQVCRVPWCSAPVRHVDHAKPHSDGGPTSTDNGEGLCVGHNLAKEDPGWAVLPASAAELDTTAHAAITHAVTWRSPTGATCISVAPPLLGWGSEPTHPGHTRAPAPDSPLEAGLRAFLDAA